MTDVPAGYSTGFVGQMTLAELAAFIALVASGAGDFNDIAITGSTIDSSVIGGTTPAAVNATTLAASSTVSGTGFSTYLASPPAIGGTAPAGVVALIIRRSGGPRPRCRRGQGNRSPLVPNRGRRRWGSSGRRCRCPRPAGVDPMRRIRTWSWLDRRG